MKIILGSQSAQRRDLLLSVIEADQLVILPPLSDQEPGFEECTTLDEIELQLKNIVEIKQNDVLQQMQRDDRFSADDCVICADTVVVAGRPAWPSTKADSHLVLGKPDSADWQNTVRHWFAEYYSGKTHDVWTCFCVATETAKREMIVKTSVTFSRVDNTWVDWYLTTEEPIGKAGGYGIQDRAAVFVDRIEGSLSNVIGLPVFEIRTALLELGVINRSALSGGKTGQQAATGFTQ